MRNAIFTQRLTSPSSYNLGVYVSAAIWSAAEP